MEQKNTPILFVIFALFVCVFGSNFGTTVYAEDSSEKKEHVAKIDEKKQQREEKIDEKKQQREEKINEKKQQSDTKINEQKQIKDEFKEDYKIKLEEKKKQVVNFQKELREKYKILKNEFKEKYQQLRISKISDLKEGTSYAMKLPLSDDEKIESEIKLKELRLLEYEFREKIKNLKLESKEQFDALKFELKIQDDERKNMIRDRINELKEKYKDKIREYDNHDIDVLEKYSGEYEGKKINICHVTSENSGNSQTISIAVNAWKSHMLHGDSIGKCEESAPTDNTDESVNDEGQNIEIELKEDIGIHSNNN